MDFSEFELLKAQERLLAKRKMRQKNKKIKGMSSLKTILEDMPDRKKNKATGVKG